MAEKWIQHIGDDQLVYGMPKHMSAVAGSGESAVGGRATYWRYHPKPQACEKCQAMKGLWFEKNPGPVHPNCKCEIEEVQAIRVTGRSDAITVPPGVDLAANISEARRVAKECEAKARKIVSQSAGHYSSEKAVEYLTFGFKCKWIYDNFAAGMRYDYKKDGHPEYEDFGNYHYGLYTRAMGINVTLAQAAAGAWQIKRGTSDWSFVDTWFDDPRDNRRIREGQQYPLD
ncbi:polymorphic toxin type 44 domain-containing protein [Pseudodesulfovibrio sediminis]|uniref:Bacterial toxin 44 domain-containing protein n=1 Tax=Pseudodesulfovibrio sediminis TaxID=2810563 RepID=A0ABM8I3D2_9BACT|nr:polymorphic toxin type 44 domain-containing protein [Pseudodesulfovibrio sediminis]BCS89554.1 hypothetical protein PSDVSF_27960 [Pseudodesulfovibrio sediminis]